MARAALLTIDGVGVDAVDVGRFTEAATRRPRLLERLFDPEELLYAGDGKNRWERLAARFAAKEAIVKAAGGFRGSEWRDLVVGGRLNQPPPVTIRGPMGDWLRDRNATILISITHERTLAVAVAVLRAGAAD
jgi:holo-[acyl-carrier protein] synthase